MVEQSTYTTKLRYFAVERSGLIYDISKILSGLKTSIINAKIITDEKTLSAQGEITVKVKDHNHLNQMILALKSIPGIREVERSISNKKIQKH
ncbi:hypothetical protein JIY74_32710 [Vibrio harveyi]|nr:hypothetical protein [Vibrio harveyi]